MENSILYSNLAADVHPFEWVSALLSEYKELRKKSKIPPIDIDADATMIYEVSKLIRKANENRPEDLPF